MGANEREKQTGRENSKQHCINRKSAGENIRMFPKSEAGNMHSAHGSAVELTTDSVPT